MHLQVGGWHQSMGHGREGKAERPGRKELRELWSLTKRWTPQGVEVGWGEGLMQQEDLE